jgi:hypothetical protein
VSRCLPECYVVQDGYHCECWQGGGKCCGCEPPRQITFNDPGTTPETEIGDNRADLAWEDDGGSTSLRSR